MEQVLPAPATPPVSASHSIPLPMPGTGPSVDPTALTVIATAVRGRKGSSTGHSRLPLSDRGRRRQPPLAAPRGGRPAEAERGSAANRRMRVRRGAVRCVRRRSRFVPSGRLAREDRRARSHARARAPARSRANYRWMEKKIRMSRASRSGTSMAGSGRSGRATTTARSHRWALSGCGRWCPREHRDAGWRSRELSVMGAGPVTAGRPSRARLEALV
jgi:hypothetical protein